MLLFIQITYPILLWLTSGCLAVVHLVLLEIEEADTIITEGIDIPYFKIIILGPMSWILIIALNIKFWWSYRKEN